MKKRINTVGYLFGHWGTGMMMGGFICGHLQGIMFGLFVHLIGQFTVGMTKEEWRK